MATNLDKVIRQIESEKILTQPQMEPHGQARGSWRSALQLHEELI